MIPGGNFGPGRWRVGTTAPVTARDLALSDPNALTGRIGIAQVTVGAGLARHLPTPRPKASATVPPDPAGEQTKLAICG